MAQCVCCKTETEMSEGRDVPMCPVCRDARKSEREPAAAEQVRRLLIQESVEATARANVALRAFNEVLNQFPSGLPHPDGTQCIEDASRKLIAARKAMGRSNNRLNDYLSRGIVPLDLKRSG
jgi:hypothetical protein